MTAGDRSPTRDEVRQILLAAADVIFSDGVSESFLDYWADQTELMLALLASRQEAPRDSPVGLADEPARASMPRTFVEP